MKIQTIPSINFKSDYYGFRKSGNSFYLTSIKTDDLPKENQKLILRLWDSDGTTSNDYPMTYDGKYYVYKEDNLNTHYYKILNKKMEVEEKEIEIDELAISKLLNTYHRLSIGKPAEQIISKGSAEGLVVTDLNNIPSDKPVILMIDKLRNLIIKEIFLKI